MGADGGRVESEKLEQTQRRMEMGRMWFLKGWVPPPPHEESLKCVWGVWAEVYRCLRSRFFSFPLSF